jgi:hypothetical protein
VLLNIPVVVVQNRGSKRLAVKNIVPRAFKEVALDRIIAVLLIGS